MYLYRHIRLDINMPFYIGIGTVCNNYGGERSKYARAYSMSRRTRHWKNIVAKVGYSVDIIMESDDIDFIKKKETEFINLYGRKDLGKGVLINKTDGGQGNFGKEQLEFLSKLHTGRKHTEKAKLAISKYMKTRVISDYTRKLQSEKKLGKPLSSYALIQSAEKRKKTVIQINKFDLSFIKEWDYIIHASTSLGIDNGDIKYEEITTSIRNCLK